MNDFKLKISDPVVVTHGKDATEPGKIQWGPYQFPGIHYTKDGDIAVTVNMGADSIVPGSSWRGVFVTKDGGKTFSDPTPGENVQHFVTLPDGTTIAAGGRAALDPKTVPLPEEPDMVRLFWRRPCNFYRATRFDRQMNAIPFTVNGQWQLINIDFPKNYLRYISEGFFAMPGAGSDFIAPDGTYWAYAYQWFEDEKGIPRFQPFFITSEDSGKTFQFRSMIPYEPDYEGDPMADLRDGFTEPVVTFLPNGDIVCLMRTQDGNGQGPAYITFSHDNGYTWEKPAIFDDLGVLPQLLHLGCGVTLSAYGRPGVFLRATDDPTAHVWQDRITVVEHEWTCAYTRFLAISDTEALFVYTDFMHPDADGITHKTVLCRKIEVVR